MKKVLSLMLAGLALFALFGCGGGGEPEKQPPEEQQQPPVVEEDPPTPVYEDWAEDGELSVLMIGNSFSDDTLWQSRELARGFGIEKATFAIMFVGSCTVETHLLNAINDTAAYELRTFDENGYRNTTQMKLSTVVPSRSWDYISLQQASIDSGISSTYECVPALVREVKKLLPEGEDPRFVWNMTWAYPQDTTHTMFNRYDCSQEVMYRRITEAVREKILPDETFSLISPTGTAVQNVRSSYIGDTLCRDLAHLTVGLGRYIAGLTFLSTVTGKTPVECKYRLDGMSETQHAAVVECVTNALAHPFEVTESIYKG